MTSRPNPVLLLLGIVALLALGLSGLVAHAPNRLVSGEALHVWRAVGPIAAAATLSLAALLVVSAFARPQRALHLGVIAVAAFLVLLLLDDSGAAARRLFDPALPGARTSFGAGFWAATLCASLAILDALQRMDATHATRLAVVATVVALVAALLLSGRLDEVSLLREYASERGAFSSELLRHCLLVLGAVVPALIIGMALGVLASRQSATHGPIFATLNIVQTVPSIALFGLLLTPLAALARWSPTLAALGVSGIGPAPALLALVLYSLLPVARNTVAGLASVDPAVVESASGMGFTRRQIFWRVELPLAAPVLLAGVRVVVVQAIGLAVVAALIGAGGLGTFVFRGIGQYAIDMVLLGAVPTILLALAADFAMALAIDLTQRRTR